MRSRPNPEHVLSSAIDRLARQITAERLEDPDGPDEARERFEAVQDNLGHGETPAIAALCTIAMRLLANVSNQTALSVEDQRRVIGDIVAQLAALATWKGVGAENVPELSVSARIARDAIETAADEDAMKVWVADGKRLGELVVQMSMLTAEQVRLALDVQSQTGARLGATLVELNMISPDMVDQLLKLQKRKRMAHRDVWTPEIRVRGINENPEPDAKSA
jgi:hypothetical protein